MAAGKYLRSAQVARKYLGDGFGCDGMDAQISNHTLCFGIQHQEGTIP